MDKSEESKRRMDALDLIISLLQEHERNLDRICARLEKTSEDTSVDSKNRAVEASRQATLLEQVDDWEDFKAKAQRSSRIVFNMGPGFDVYAVGEGVLFKYTEPLMSRKGLFQLEEPPGNSRLELECGLELVVRSKRDVSAEAETEVRLTILTQVRDVRRWLASQLGLEENHVVEGRVVL